MVDRRAIVIGSWLSKEESSLSNQKVVSITKHWTKIFKDESFSFKSLLNNNELPTPMHNPAIADITAQFEQATNISANTELLIYYLGDSTSSGPDDIELSLGEKSDGDKRTIEFSRLLAMKDYLPTKINRIVLILDTCHAGRTGEIFKDIDIDYFAMFASNSGYAFNANFTEGIFRAFEDPLRRRDQRVDRRNGGVTYNKIFEYATKYVLEQNKDNEYSQIPKCHGEYKGEILIEAPIIVPNEYVSSISNRTIYARVFRILEIIGENKIPSIRELRTHINADRSFLIRRDEEEGDQYISQKRINEYLDFLRDIEWIQNNESPYLLTLLGKKALNRDNYNKLLLEGIENKILPVGLTLDMLDNIVMELLDDMIPPTPIKIQERTTMKGIRLYLNSGVRVALQILPSTGRFLKGSSDAIFPSEY